MVSSFINFLSIIKGGIIVNRAQYDDVYTEWIENGVFLDFDGDYELEECYARTLRRLYH